MATPIFGAATPISPGPRAQSLRYRLDVIALDVAEVVLSAGGWLYHRAAAGWEVTALVPGDQDARPLQILGVRTLDLDGELAAPVTAGHGLAVGDNAFASDIRVRHRLLSALRSSRTEVILWGDRWPVAVRRRMCAVHHVLTGSARAFKAQSLVAAAVAGAGVDSTEVFRSDQKRWLPVDSDLSPLR